MNTLLALASAKEWPKAWAFPTFAVTVAEELSPSALRPDLSGVIVVPSAGPRIAAIAAIERFREDCPVALLAAGPSDMPALESVFSRFDFDGLLDLAWPASLANTAIQAALRQSELARNIVQIQRVALEQVRQENSTLYDQAMHDDLTKLYNQRIFGELMAREHDRIRRERGRYVLLFIDLDDLKGVNTRYGHTAGSLALAEIAGTLTAAIRKSDMAVRVGGDEFVVFLSDCSKQDGIEFAERLCQRVRNAPMAYEGHGVRLSISVGVAVYPDHGSNYVELVKRADEALQRAKDTGKGRAVIAGQRGGA